MVHTHTHTHTLASLSRPLKLGTYYYAVGILVVGESYLVMVHNVLVLVRARLELDHM